jgi:hypothetical protein
MLLCLLDGKHTAGKARMEVATSVRKSTQGQVAVICPKKVAVNIESSGSSTDVSWKRDQ